LQTLHAPSHPRRLPTLATVHPATHRVSVCCVNPRRTQDAHARSEGGPNSARGTRERNSETASRTKSGPCELDPFSAMADHDGEGAEQPKRQRRKLGFASAAAQRRVHGRAAALSLLQRPKFIARVVFSRITAFRQRVALMMLSLCKFSPSLSSAPAWAPCSQQKTQAAQSNPRTRPLLRRGFGRGCRRPSSPPAAEQRRRPPPALSAWFRPLPPRSLCCFTSPARTRGETLTQKTAGAFLPPVAGAAASARGASRGPPGRPESRGRGIGRRTERPLRRRRRRPRWGRRSRAASSTRCRGKGQG